MTEGHAVQRAREWLERQLAELGQLRNATRRDQNFKAWRQSTLTVIQRTWPGDVNRMDRFRRIPFSPPMARATDRQVREYYERGWGEAGVLLREYLAEINLRGLPERPGAGGGFAEAEPEIAPLPTWEEPHPLGDEIGAPPTLPGPAAAEAEPTGEDDISRAMEKLLSSSPVFRSGASLPAPPSAPTESETAAELVRAVEELESLGLTPGRAAAAREVLLALARTPSETIPDWALVREALAEASATPALARRLLPLLLAFVDRAA